MRGRYNSDGKIEQQLGSGSSDYADTLTTVSKDNYIIENRKEQQFYPEKEKQYMSNEVGTYIFQAMRLWKWG